MGVAGGDVDPKIAMVMCKGTLEATRQIEELDRIHSCKSAKMFYGGNWACPYGCLGMGDCADACQFDAIRVVDGVAQIDREKCVGCEACMKACPNHIIQMVGKKNLFVVACQSKAKGAQTRKACTAGCIGCMKCQKICKFEAVTVENNLATIDYDKCKNCGMCAKECPTGAILSFRKKKAPAKKPAAPKAEAPAAEAPKADAPAEAPKAEETKNTEA